jgi:hypothetical protein
MYQCKRLCCRKRGSARLEGEADGGIEQLTSKELGKAESAS